MRNVAIVGDCHTSRIFEHYKKDQTKLDIHFWGLAGYRAHALDYKKTAELKVRSSGMELPPDGQDHSIEFNELPKCDLVIPWIGYVDIRTYLTRYDNADEIARTYVDITVDYFKDSNILFAEPLPQFKQMLLKFPGISAEYTYEDRQNQNKLFLAGMNNRIEELGLPKPISQEEILAALGVNELDESMTRNIAPHPMDGLDDIYNEKIMYLFVAKAENFFNTLDL
jgi:hypothetical protein